MGKRCFIAVFVFAIFLFYIAPANAAGCVTGGGGTCTTEQAGQQGNCNEGFWCSDCGKGPFCYQVPSGMSDLGCSETGERNCGSATTPTTTPTPSPGTSPQPSACSYQSTQARVQKDATQPWANSLNINLGESFRIASFHNENPVYATDTALKVTGPNIDRAFNNGDTVTPQAAGIYTLTVTTNSQTGANCEDRATVTVSASNPCANGVKDGTETDIDCGGSCQNKCANGKICAANTDCQSALCDLTGPDTSCNRVGPNSQGGRCVTCDGSTKKQSSLGGYGQGCCEQVCGATQVCDEYSAESNCIQCSSTTTPINKAPKIEREIAQIPASIKAGETTIINITYSDEDGANDISSIFFAISPGGNTGEAYCTQNFEFPLSKYFGAVVRLAQDRPSYTTAVYDSAPSQGPDTKCPWGQQALTGELANKPGTAKLLGINENGNTTITKSGNQVRAGFKIEFSRNFPQGDYNVYAMVSDSKNAFQTGATAAWDKIGAISVRKVKYSWDFSKSGACAQNEQCFVEENKCISNNEHISDHYCLDGEWTSRTKFAALQLLDYAKNKNLKDYSLFCGNYSETANYFEYAVGETPVLDYLKDVNSICVLKYSDKVIFASVLNKSLQDSGFLNVLNIESCNGQGLYACDKTNRAWHDSDKRILYYSDSEITLLPGAVEGAVLRIINLFRSLLNFAGKSATDQNIEFITQTRDFSRVYLNTKGTRNIVGMIEKKFSDNKQIESMAVNYSGFSENICAFVKEAVGGACTSSAGRYSLYFSKEAGQQLPNDLFNYWPDLTAKLRIGECLVPRTASECSGTQGSKFCGDENGRFLIDGACCSASNKFVSDGVCLTPCVDADRDNFGVGEACTGVRDCNDNNGDIHPDNSNPYCDCNANDNGVAQGAAEICSDGIDNDCDGKVDASDNDCILPETAGCVITDKFCSNNKGVLSLYKESNSNAAVYGKGPLNLCCSDKANAGCQFSCGASQQGAELLYLYKEENSHVSYINPDTNIRIGCKLEGACGNKKLELCQWWTPGAMGSECPDSSYQCIASAYDVQNAHLGPCNYYERNICCKITG